MSKKLYCCNKMSLATVLEGFQNPLKSSGFYKQKVGIANPRGENIVTLVYDVQTGAPLALPLKAVPIIASLSSVVQLNSTDTEKSQIQVVFLKDPNNLNDFVRYSQPYSIRNVNNKLSVDMLHCYNVGKTEYLYAALLCCETPSTPDPTPPAITDGTIKIIYQYV